MRPCEHIFSMCCSFLGINHQKLFYCVFAIHLTFETHKVRLKAVFDSRKKRCTQKRSFFHAIWLAVEIVAQSSIFIALWEFKYFDCAVLFAQVENGLNAVFCSWKHRRKQSDKSALSGLFGLKMVRESRRQILVDFAKCLLSWKIVSATTKFWECSPGKFDVFCWKIHIFTYYKPPGKFDVFSLKKSILGKKNT